MSGSIGDQLMHSSFRPVRGSQPHYLLGIYEVVVLEDLSSKS